MEYNESSSSQQAPQTTDGSETSSPKSGKSSEKRRGGRFKMSMKEQREAVRLYKEKAGTAAEIAKIYGVHYTTIFETLDRFGVPRHRAKGSLASSIAMKRRWDKERNEMSEMHLVAEEPSPVIVEEPETKSPGVDIDAVHRTKRKYTRKKKSLWHRLKNALFGR